MYETKAAHQHFFGVSVSRKKSFISRLPILLPAFAILLPAFAHLVVLCVTDNTTVENIISDKISRLKKLTSTGSKSQITPFSQYLQLCQPSTGAFRSLQPSHKLVSLFLKILLTGNCPDLKQFLKLRPQDLGKLSI